MTTNETKKAVGATNSNGLHTDTNIGDFHTIEAAKHKKQRAKEALNGLEKNNVLAVNGDRLCIT